MHCKHYLKQSFVQGRSYCYSCVPPCAQASLSVFVLCSSFKCKYMPLFFFITHTHTHIYIWGGGGGGGGGVMIWLGVNRPDLVPCYKLICYLVLPFSASIFTVSNYS